MFTLKEIKNAYSQKKEWEKQFPINYYLVRPFSFYLTYIVLQLTKNPSVVALLGFILGGFGCFLLLFSSVISPWPGILLILAYSISDAIDGNVARTTQNVTLWGIYIDGLIGNLIEGNYFFFLGIGLYLGKTAVGDTLVNATIQEHAQILPLLLGSIILISKLWANIFEMLHNHYGTMKDGLEAYEASILKRKIGKSKLSNRWYYLLFINIDSLNNQLFLLILSVIFNLEIWFLIYYTIFFSAKAFFYLFYYFERTKSKITA